MDDQQIEDFKKLTNDEVKELMARKAAVRKYQQSSKYKAYKRKYYQENREKMLNAAKERYYNFYKF